MRAFLISLIALAAVVGMADSWYLYQSAITDTALTCQIGGGLDGCNTVAQSPYSYLFGLPLALYGIGFYLAVFLGALLSLVAPRPLWHKGLVVLGAVGALASTIFVYIQVVLIEALCIYCLISAALTFIILALALALRPKKEIPLTLAV